MRLRVERCSHANAFRAKAPEALEVLIRCLQSDDERIAIMAAQAILDRGYGKPVQSIDANITEDGGPIRYYAELPKKAESAEQWLSIVAVSSAVRPEPSLSPLEPLRERIPSVGVENVGVEFVSEERARRELGLNGARDAEAGTALPAPNDLNLPVADNDVDPEDNT
jgi:hypothetical protein